MEVAYMPPGVTEDDSAGYLGRDHVAQLKLQAILDDLAVLAILACQAQQAWVVLLDDEQQVVAENQTPPHDDVELPASLVQALLQQPGVMCWPEHGQSEWETSFPALAQLSGFWAGVAIRAENQQILGYLVVSTDQPQQNHSSTQRSALQVLARQARGLLDEHHKSLTLQRIKNREARFLQLISQDLKKPFSAILGFSAALQEVEDLSDSQLQLVLNRIHGAAQSAYAILNHLLLWARYELGAFSFSPRWVQLSDVFDNILPGYRVQAASKGVTIHLSASLDAVIYADWRMALTIISHILDNAIKYSPRDTEVEIKQIADVGANIVSIEDHGTGISAERMAQLFQLSSEQCCEGTAGERGTGLGLPLSKDFMDWHGGEIRVHSIPAQGSRFDLVFPNPKTCDTH